MTEETLYAEIVKHTYGHDGKRWCAYWYFVGWWSISLGFHVSTYHKNMEIHLPFGFFRFGMNDKSWPS